MKVFSMKFSLPTDPRKFSPSKIYHYTVSTGPCCSYELIRLLQRRVHGSVGRLIDTKLEERVLEGDGHSVVAQITEDVLNSAE